MAAVGVLPLYCGRTGSLVVIGLYVVTGGAGCRAFASVPWLVVNRCTAPDDAPNVELLPTTWIDTGNFDFCNTDNQTRPFGSEHTLQHFGNGVGNAILLFIVIVIIITIIIINGDSTDGKCRTIIGKMNTLYASKSYGFRNRIFHCEICCSSRFQLCFWR